MRRLARTIRDRRLELNLSQEHVAHEAGLATRYYQDLETGRGANPSLRAVWNVARALDSTLPEMLATRPRGVTRERATKSS